LKNPGGEDQEVIHHCEGNFELKKTQPTVVKLELRTKAKIRGRSNKGKKDLG
jgi:hypothetical protein